MSLGGNVFGWSASPAESFRVLDAYTAAGGNFIDTADSYSAWAPGNEGGESERIIGDWLASRRNRADVVIATKVSAHPQHRGLAPATIAAAAEDSLRRLRTDHIDLYYTHFDDLSVPVEDIIAALDRLVTQGKVRAIAASNITPERLEASLAFSAREGCARYVALQPHYNLMEREFYETSLRPIALRHDLAVFPYFSLAAGFLTGKYRPGEPIDSVREPRVTKYLGTERGHRVLATIDQIAATRATYPATIALAWLLAQPSITAPLASARTLAQLPPILAAADFDLKDDELTALSEAST
ncbi:aldo/keto reductase [Spongiactinospora rosea]|uniref:aldo/keto reductase n=1 Tax=Spongiactinospora rosea TaxID=2248750 RepID=UPI001CED55FC|nr:aldo/keto reductase [Spongiactinospora rosea]